MKLKKILVTGGAGYIGSHTAVVLAEAGYEPVLVDNFSNSERFIIERIRKITGRKIAFYAADCAVPRDLKCVFEKEKHFCGIIHFAALKAVGESVEKPLLYYQNNLGSMTAILEAAAKYHVPYFVFSSSCTVYGDPKKFPVTEQTPLPKAMSPYGDTKQISERILENFLKTGVPIKGISLRYFNPIGAHPSALIGELPLGAPKNLVPFVAQTAARIRKVLHVFGDDYKTPDGTCIRDYIHVMDLAQAHVRALHYLEKKSGANFYDVFNIGTGRGHSVLEIIKTFEKVTGAKVPYRVVARRPGDIARIYASTSKAKAIMGWNSRLSLEEALRSTWEWQKSLRAGGR